MATLINGNGNPAVYAGQDADLYAGTIGAATRILNVGSKFAATIEDANTIAIADGVIVTKEGRRIQLDVGSIDEFLIPTGQAGTTRYYIIGYHLYTDGSANQLCETFVQLMNTSTETITENTFRGGFNEVYVSLYRVTQNGLTLNTPAALLSVSETIAQLRDKVNPAMQDILWYGTCATAAATQAKVATTTDRKLTNLTAGQKVAIKMTYNNTHASPTLNVDGKGAKSIKAYGTTAPKVWWKAGDVVTFVYDGTNWLMGVTAGEIEQINSDLTELNTHLSNYVKFQSKTDGVTIAHGDYTSFNNLKPSISGYEWHLMQVLPSTGAVQITGVDGDANRVMALTTSQSSQTISVVTGWLGIKS